jgi:hypothetical protein
MSTNFLSLPSELRNRIYELCLVWEEPINPCMDYFYSGQEVSPTLLRANKTIHREARPLFYGQNCFDFTMITRDRVTPFLEIISRSNADYIRQVRVDFPMFRSLDLGDVTLEEDSISIFANIHSGCANLSTLTTNPPSRNDERFCLDGLDHPRIAAQALELVNTTFRAISSLQEIVIEVCENTPSHYMKEKMKSHGWTINVVECVDEDSYGSIFGDIEEQDWYDNDYDDDYLNNEYDIDTDSGFWRRAGD